MEEFMEMPVANNPALMLNGVVTFSLA